jgi:hypothetical protein
MNNDVFNAAMTEQLFKFYKIQESISPTYYAKIFLLESPAFQYLNFRFVLFVGRKVDFEMLVKLTTEQHHNQHVFLPIYGALFQQGTYFIFKQDFLSVKFQLGKNCKRNFLANVFDVFPRICQI